MTRLRRRVAASAVVALLALGSSVVIAGAVQAVPDQPVILGPFFTTSSSVEVSVNVVSDVNLTMTVFVDGDPSPTCTGVDIYYQFEPTCFVSLDAGFGYYTLTAVTTDGDGVGPVSDPFIITYGGTGASTITNPAPGVSVVGLSAPFEGTGPPLGTMMLSAQPTGGGAIVNVCGPLAITVAGTWSCSASFPELRDWDVFATGTDLGGIVTSSASQVLGVEPPRPDLLVALLPGSADVTVSGVSGSDTVVTLYTDFGGATLLDSRCPFDWSGDYSAPPASGTPLACSFSLPAGIHLFSSVQFINGTYSSDRGDLIRVPSEPTLNATGVAGGALFSGTVDPVDLATTVHDIDQVTVFDGLNALCFAAVDPITGEWACGASMVAGDYTVEAHTTSFGFADDPAIPGIQQGYHNGISDFSESVSVTALPAVPPGVPDVSYGIGPGSVTVTATGGPLSQVAIGVYETSDNGEGYDWDLTYGCPTLLDDEGLYVPHISQMESCTFNLAPGIWNFFTNQVLYDADIDDFLTGDYQDDYVLIPAAPTLSANVNANRSVTFSGSGTPGFLVRVHDSGNVIRCLAQVNAGGSWSCTYSPGLGTTNWRATQLSQGFVANPGGGGPFGSYQGISAFTGELAVVVAVAPGATPTSTPTATPIPWTLKGLDKVQLVPGETIVIGSDGLPPGATIDIEIQSTPRDLGSTVVKPDGSFSLSITIPIDMESGNHTLVATLTPVGGVPSVVSRPVAIVPLTPEKAVAPPQEPKVGAGTGTNDLTTTGGSTADLTDRSNPAAVSSLTESLATWRDVFANPITLVGAAGLGLALLFLVAFPAELLNSTLSSNSQRLGRAFAAVESAINRGTAWFIRVTRTPALAAAVIVLITSVIFGFVDPRFGFDPVSLRLVLSLAIGLFVVSYVSSWISSRVIKRAWGVEASIQLQPAALIFAALGVIVARALDFSPGFLVGLVIGLEIAVSTKEPYRSRAIVTHLGILVALSVVAWLGFSVATALLSPQPGFVDLLVIDALAATTVEGLTAATVALLPLGFLEGRNLFQHSKRLWLITFATVATLFCLLVLPTASGDAGVRDWVSWTLVLVGFAVVTLALWAYFHFSGNRTTKGDDPVSFDSPDDDPVILDRVESL